LDFTHSSGWLMLGVLVCGLRSPLRCRHDFVLLFAPALRGLDFSLTFVQLLSSFCLWIARYRALGLTMVFLHLSLLRAPCGGLPAGLRVHSPGILPKLLTSFLAPLHVEF
jgi:hypothetical protein